jgi:hypothetical protein
VKKLQALDKYLEPDLSSGHVAQSLCHKQMLLEAWSSIVNGSEVGRLMFVVDDEIAPAPLQAGEFREKQGNRHPPALHIDKCPACNKVHILPMSPRSLISIT